MDNCGNNADKYTSCVGMRETYQSELNLDAQSDTRLFVCLSDNISWLKVIKSVQMSLMCPAEAISLPLIKQETDTHTYTQRSNSKDPIQ